MLNVLSLVGWFVLALLAWLIGGCRRPVPWRTVAGSALMTFGLGAVVFLLPTTRSVPVLVNDALAGVFYHGQDGILGL